MITKIEKIGHEEIIRLARKILKKYPKPQVFTMAMGTYFFEDEYGEILYEPRYTKEIDSFLCDLDIKFGFTGWSVRITKDLKIDKEYAD